ncbi:MAG: GNAT family N-acetyltransferase [Deltaproteobacteria bacterium]|nr:GNAT family N-acetyltransferase [Nannocystaceae bacterium]
MAFTLRELDRVTDHDGVAAIDTAFETASVFELAIDERRLELVERTLPQPRIKRYDIAELFAPWCTWDHGYVAVDGGIVGVAVVEYEPWHRRLTLWHLYVGRPRRREGIARALLERVETHGRKIGALRVWLETSTVNVPGIAAYARLGYTLCGVDSTYYEATDVADEVAVYLSKPL